MSDLAKVPSAESIEKVLIGGNLSVLTPAERLAYYKAVCESIGLNPLTKPFEYITLNGKMVLYATRDASEQLRKLHNVSVEKLEKEFNNEHGLYIVTAYGEIQNGRRDTGTGAVCITNLKGDNLANALMKAETKAKRRLTLSICGLGLLDETEVDSIPRFTRKQMKSLVAAPESEDVTQEVDDTPDPIETTSGKVQSFEGLISHLKGFEGYSIAKIAKQTIVVIDDNLQADFRKFFQEKLEVRAACLEKTGEKGIYWEARAVCENKSLLEMTLNKSAEIIKNGHEGLVKFCKDNQVSESDALRIAKETGVGDFPNFQGIPKAKLPHVLKAIEGMVVTG